MKFHLSFSEKPSNFSNLDFSSLPLFLGLSESFYLYWPAGRSARRGRRGGPGGGWGGGWGRGDGRVIGGGTGRITPCQPISMSTQSTSCQATPPHVQKKIPHFLPKNRGHHFRRQVLISFVCINSKLNSFLVFPNTKGLGHSESLSLQWDLPCTVRSRESWRRREQRRELPVLW